MVEKREKLLMEAQARRAGSIVRGFQIPAWIGRKKQRRKVVIGGREESQR